MIKDFGDPKKGCDPQIEKPCVRANKVTCWFPDFEVPFTKKVLTESQTPMK
jgi:hypothetical protein